MNTYSSSEEILIKPERLNRIGLIFLPCIVFCVGLPYYCLKHWAAIVLEWNFFSHWFLPIIFFGIIIHEGIHGIICGLLAPSKFKAIHFGFSKDMLSPYTHCSEILKGWQYALSLLAPGVILGAIPCLIAMFSTNTGYLFGGLIFIWGAVGDFAILWAIRNKLKNTHIQDHPSMAGCIVYFKA